MTDTTSNLALPYIMPSQAQKHITHNESLRMLDAQIHIGVEAASLSTPPLTPIESARYIVGDAATDAWTGKETQLAAWQDGAWAFFAPQQGWLAHISNTDEVLAFDGSQWAGIRADMQNLAGIGINTNSDAYNKVSIKSDSVLISHDDVTPGSGDARMTLNKQALGNVSVLQLQTGYSGRVELGLIGNDAFSIRYDLPVLGWKSLLYFDETSGDAKLFGNAVIDTQGQVDVPAKFQTITNNDRGNIQFYNSANGEYWEMAAELKTGKALKFISSDGAISNVPITIDQAASTDSLHISSTGDVGLGKVPSGTKLDVDGAIKPASYLVASLPDAVTSGAGAMIYVSDETGGGVPAFSDGTDWRRVSDRAIVS